MNPDAKIVCRMCGSTYVTPLAADQRRCPYQDKHTVAVVESLRAVGSVFDRVAGPGVRKKPPEA